MAVAVCSSRRVALFFLPLPDWNPGQGICCDLCRHIVALVARPFPMGVTFDCNDPARVTRTLSAEKVLSGFSNPTVWWSSPLSCLRGRHDDRTGLRIAYLFIRRFGHTALTLGIRW